MRSELKRGPSVDDMVGRVRFEFVTWEIEGV
jgi:hypothetical protein